MKTIAGVQSQVGMLLRETKDAQQHAIIVGRVRNEMQQKLAHILAQHDMSIGQVDLEWQDEDVPIFGRTITLRAVSR